MQCPAVVLIIRGQSLAWPQTQWWRALRGVPWCAVVACVTWCAVYVGAKAWHAWHERYNEDHGCARGRHEAPELL